MCIVVIFIFQIYILPQFTSNYAMVQAGGSNVLLHRYLGERICYVEDKDNVQEFEYNLGRSTTCRLD